MSKALDFDRDDVVFPVLLSAIKETGLMPVQMESIMSLTGWTRDEVHAVLDRAEETESAIKSRS